MRIALIHSRLPVSRSALEACLKANYDSAGFERGFASGDMEDECVCKQVCALCLEIGFQKKNPKKKKTNSQIQ